MKIQEISITQLKPYWRNPRVNEKTSEEVKKSIIKFGFKVPIVVDSENVIITGHSRFKALNQLKGNLTQEILSAKDELTKATESASKKRLTLVVENLSKIHNGFVNIVVADDLTQKQAKEYRISDNKISEFSTWDANLLKCEVKELGDVIGFDDSEIAELLADVKIDLTELTDEDLEKTSKKLDEKFDGLVTKQADNKVEVSCPHCNKEFYIDKSEVNKS